VIEPSGVPPARIWGLDNIARALGVSLRTLQRMLDWPNGERPPIRHCHRGYYAFEIKLQLWVDANDMDAGVYRKLMASTREGATDAADERDDARGRIMAQSA